MTHRQRQGTFCSRSSPGCGDGRPWHCFSPRPPRSSLVMAAPTVGLLVKRTSRVHFPPPPLLLFTALALFLNAIKPAVIKLGRPAQPGPGHFLSWLVLNSTIAARPGEGLGWCCRESGLEKRNRKLSERARGPPRVQPKGGLACLHACGPGGRPAEAVGYAAGEGERGSHRRTGSNEAGADLLVQPAVAERPNPVKPQEPPLCP